LATGGVDQALKGRQLPQAPHWTVALGAQYQWDITGAWNATARVDYYRRSDSYSRIYNTISDKVPAYDNTNISLVMANPKLDLDVQLFVKNVGNNTSITNIYLSDEAAAFTRNVFLLDPRTYGISVTKRF
jgi:outer membrane receptor protein involved in Fe transport